MCPESFWLSMSSRNSRAILNGRPPSSTSTSPFALMSSIFPRNRFDTCAASAGAAMVTTARASEIWLAAASTAAPPRLWPIRSEGACASFLRWFVAATRSATFEEKCVFLNSPSLAPRPVKSKRKTAMPSSVSPSAMRFAACTSFPQVKQCANSAKARGLSSGRSRRAARRSPLAFGKSKRCDGMSVSQRKTPSSRIPARFRNGFTRECDRLGEPGRRAAIDGDRGAVDVRAALGAEEGHQLRDVFGLCDAANARFLNRALDRVFARNIRGLCARFRKLEEPFGFGGAGMNDIHIHAVALAEIGEPFGKIRERPVDRAADQEILVRRACGAAHDIDDIPFRRFQHRPEQPREADGREEFQREAVMPFFVIEVEEVAGLGGARAVHERVAASETRRDEFEQSFAFFELLEIARAGEGGGAAGLADGFGGVEQVLRR